MKMATEEGIGTVKKQAQPISEEQEVKQPLKSSHKTNRHWDLFTKN